MTFADGEVGTKSFAITILDDDAGSIPTLSVGSLVLTGALLVMMAAAMPRRRRR